MNTVSSAKPYQRMVYVVRFGHFIIGISMTLATVYLWYSGLFRALNLWTIASIALLAGQWIIVMLNHGNCPLGVVHARYGDEKTLFELVAGKRYAPYGFRNWAVLCILGALLLVLRFLFT